MSEATITLDSRDEAVLLFGSRDTNLREIRTALGAQYVVIKESSHIHVQFGHAATAAELRRFAKLVATDPFA